MAKTKKQAISDSSLRKFLKSEASGPYSYVANCPIKPCSVRYWTNRPEKGVSFLRTHIERKHSEEKGGELVPGKEGSKS